MLLALTTPTGNRSPLPPIARTLPQAELIHKALVSRAANGGTVHCPELTGRDDAGELLRGHRHAHILPVDLDEDGHLDHVLVYASMGLGHTAQQAIRGLQRTWTKGLDADLRLAVAGHGSLLDLQRLPAPLSQGIAALTGGPEGASTWRSLTPLVLPRYLKRRGPNTIEGQVNAELKSRDLPPARIEVLPWSDRTLKVRHVVRVRRRPAQPPPVDVPHVLRLIFDRPVRGPLSIGYASHYGLGLFAVEQA
jgi:CRISPR-associated protein Csb2